MKGNSFFYELFRLINERIFILGVGLFDKGRCLVGGDVFN
jgi:hypothetical protein